MGTIKSEIEKAMPAACKALRKRHHQTIRQIFEQFCKNLKDVAVTDPQGRAIIFRVENFPYLIKMQYLNVSEGRWVAATASVVIPALEDGTFDEARHQYDTARAKGLLRIREILAAPDSIHENIHPRVNGEIVYVRCVGGPKGAIKLAFTTRNRLNEWVLVTSFYTTTSYVKTCAKHPPLYKKK